MARININNIENVEGKYHLMFLEGKNMVENSKDDKRFAWFSLLCFFCMIVVCVLISGFNLFYAGFLVVFLIFFAVGMIFFSRQKRIGKKQCIYAVQNSNTRDIVAKQVDHRGVSKAIVKSMSTTIDKYDEKQKYKGFLQKYKRKRRHSHIVGIISEFEKEEQRKR